MSTQEPQRYVCALFKNMECGFTTVFGQLAVRECELRMIGYVRISDIVEIEFPALSNNDVIAGAVRALDERRAEVAKEFGAKLAEIDRQKSDLLALTHQVAA